MAISEPIIKKENLQAHEATADGVVDAARKYVGMPYRTQGRDSLGTDCGGLLLLVGRDLGITALEVLGYSNSPDGESFESHIDSIMDEIPREETRAGDIIACDYGKGIQHTAFVVSRDDDENKSLGFRLKIVHAKRPRDGFNGTDRGVIEQTLSGVDERAWIRSYRIPMLGKKIDA